MENTLINESVNWSSTSVKKKNKIQSESILLRPSRMRWNYSAQCFKNCSNC